MSRDGAQEHRGRQAVHRHRDDAHVHDDADADVVLPGARSDAGGRRRQGVPRACPCPTARSARRSVRSWRPTSTRAPVATPIPLDRDARPGQPELHALRRCRRVHLQHAAARRHRPRRRRRQRSRSPSAGRTTSASTRRDERVPRRCSGTAPQWAASRRQRAAAAADPGRRAGADKKQLYQYNCDGAASLQADTTTRKT